LKALILILLFYSCSSQTLIKTSDDVKIYIDGDFKARGSYLLRDNKIVFSETAVSLKREGCLEVNYVIRKNERLNYKSLLMSFLVLPLLWLMEYEENRVYNFECQKELI
jgi:hypothetical protein